MTFSSTSENFLQQLETYRAECTSTPAFPRVPALPIGEPQDPSAGYDYDDEFAARGPGSAVLLCNGTWYWKLSGSNYRIIFYFKSLIGHAELFFPSQFLVKYKNIWF